MLILFLRMMWAVRSTPLDSSPTTQLGPHCVDWGEHVKETVRVYEGEAGRIHCPLFSHPKLYDYPRIQSSGYTLLWFRHTRSRASEHEPEEPVDLSLETVQKYKDALWVQRASVQDSGVYICMLRYGHCGNMTSCVKISVSLEVFPRGGVCNDTLRRHISVPIQSNHTLRCPDLQHLPSSTYNVTWYYNCRSNIINGYMMEVHGDEVVIYQMLTLYAGLYTCVVHYRSNGHTFHYSHSIDIRAVSSKGPKQPKILNPAIGETHTVTVDKEAEFTCRAFLPYLNDERGQVWWSVNNRTLEEVSDPRYSSPAFRVLVNYHEDLNVERVLHVSRLTAEDLNHEYRCHVHNSQGSASRALTLKEEVYVPSVELGCGLGVTLALALLLFVLYRVFWLEVHLLYRSWFGTDERDTDNKVYDVYISYARNTEEEEFVMTTLRPVLEAEFGYTVCIFDRDSLPGGNLADSILMCMQLSRRVLVVQSGSCVCERTEQLLECRLCVHVHGTRGTPLIRVRRHRAPTTAPCCPELAELRRLATCVHWHEERSRRTASPFWKRLHLSLPLRPIALGPRLIDSTSTYSDLGPRLVDSTHTHSDLGAGRHPARGSGLRRPNSEIPSTYC